MSMILKCDSCGAIAIGNDFFMDHFLRFPDGRKVSFDLCTSCSEAMEADLRESLDGVPEWDERPDGEDAKDDEIEEVE